MSSPEDDEVLQALKAELVAFLFNQTGARQRGDRTPTVADRLSETVAGQVRQDLQRELHAFHDEVEATLEQAQYASGGGIGTLLRQPLFLIVLAVALLSIGANIGLGLALLGKPAPAATAQSADDASASEDATVSDMALEPAVPDRKTQEEACKKLTKPAERTKCLANIKTPADTPNASGHH
ncbi:MAG TPA: hypothetical protein VG839_10235 [Asticcacaulis sp.]|nr:hypothetical protein [Asticcacaulis sp.]